MNLRRLAIWIASTILLAALLTLLYFGASHLLSVPRQLLFRMALQNSAVIAISVTAAVSLLGSLGGRLIHRSTPGLQIVQLVPLTALSIALLLPPVDTALRQHLQTYPFFYTRSGGLTIIATVYTLILLPIAIVLWTTKKSEAAAAISPTKKTPEDPRSVPSSRRVREVPNTHQIPITATIRMLPLTTLFTLLNPITPLLLTGGEPVNRTYLSPAWIFHTAYVSRSYAQATAMILWIAPILFGIGFISWLSTKLRANTPH